MKIIIDEFIESLKARQATENTLASYERDIVKFSDYFEKQGKKIFDLKRSDMQEYVEYLKQKIEDYINSDELDASFKADPIDPLKDIKDSFSGFEDIYNEY